MGEIKSALDIAMERSSGISTDKSSLEAEEYVKKGKMIVSGFLGDQEATLDGCFKGIDSGQIDRVKEGMFQALNANLVLPQDQTKIDDLPRIEEGFHKIIDNSKKLKMLFEQLKGFFGEYIDSKTRIYEQLTAQYMPRLRQKEEAMSKQYGTRVHLKPESDPEFMQILKSNLAQFESQYSNVLGQAKEELRSMFGQG